MRKYGIHRPENDPSPLPIPEGQEPDTTPSDDNKTSDDDKE